MPSPLAWLQTAEARRAAQRELERLRLPADLVDDALQDAAVRLWRTQTAGSVAPEHVEAYCYRVLQNAVRDLYRRRRRRVQEAPLENAESCAGPADVEVPGALEDGCRTALRASLVEQPWAGAGALNRLTFALHPEVPLPAAAPAPDAGTDLQRAAWASLWLAGRLDCFALNGPDDAARRRKRARALDAVTDCLRVAVLAAGDTTEPAGGDA
jgi:DNA-directed RNA polymerase specialized sigma24 family protein